MAKKETPEIEEDAFPAMEKKGELEEDEWSAPFGIGVPQALKDFSPATAARQLLWACAILLSIGGIFVSLTAGVALWIGVGEISYNITSQLDGAAAGIGDVQAAVVQAQNGLASAESATGGIAASLRNLSEATTGIGDGLSALSSVPLVGGAVVSKDTTAKITSAAGGLSGAADEMTKMAQSGAGAKEAVGRLGTDLGSMKSGVLDAKKNVAGAFIMIQLGCAFGSLAGAVLFSSVLMLALSTGVPKKN